jgi:hypothetical protein
MTVEELTAVVMTLKREFEEHRHTGLDSLPITAQLENQGSLTPNNTSVVDGTYGPQEAAVISNVRDRVVQIETALQGVGILS